ncbi:serine/threonine-protein kinase [Actinomadura luteofluorescens]|uniref:serine/threonine-protein kinase n=1 Tax=Actinomadura luteofluorescens TaxID=46163 RepID=UPI0034837F82
MADQLERVLLDRYRLLDPLGRGGMGTVWHAHDERLGREVAVKELRLPEDLDAEQRHAWTARLDREARAAARLRHPGIVTVHDLVTTADGQPWIIMELVPGRSLADLLAEHGPLPPERAAALGLEILDALRAAHRVGIVHRDIKPANVLLEGERAVLTDFGIAAVDSDTTLTRSGALLGTPAYMSPEQVRGLPATAESDLWSLGATLHALVEGGPPFPGPSTGAVFVAIATQEPAPAPNAGPLAPVLRGLLRKDPAERMTLDQAQAMLAPLASSQAGCVPAPTVQQGPPAGPGQGNGGPPPQAGYGGRPYPGPPPLGGPIAGMPPSPGRSRWAGFAVAGAAALLMVAVMLPWLTVSASLPEVPGARGLTATTSGLAAGWGWGTLLCGIAAAVLGLIGGVRNKSGLAAIAAAPALLSLLILGVVAVLSRIEKPTIPVPKSLPPALGAALNENAKESLGVGWYAAVFLTLLIIGLSVVAFALANRDRPRPRVHPG